MTSSILVAEDSPTQAEQVRALLEQQGYRVTLARSGEEALTRLGAEAFDLLLTDIVMPGMNGYELCRRAKERTSNPPLPVVLLTSLADPTDIVRGLEAGADNYITKPYEPEQLLARIRRVLDSAQLRRRGRASMGVDIMFLGGRFTITSEKEQILDLLLSSVEDIVRANHILERQQRQLAEARDRLEAVARIKAEEAHTSTERYRALMHRARDAILVFDMQGMVLEVNGRAAELFGHPPEQLLGRNVRELFTAADDAELIQHRLLGAAQPGELTHVEFRLERENGEVTYCDLSASTASTGGEALVLAIIRDITERKLAGEQLRKSEQQLAEAQHIAQLGSWEWDVHSDEVVSSDETSRIFGFRFTGSRSEWRAPLTNAILPEDRLRVLNELEQVARRGGHIELEFRIHSADGTAKAISARAALTRDAAGAPQRVIGTVQDVTARKQAEEALRQSEEQLRHAQRMEAIGRLTGGIAHDFNNVLTVIMGGVQLLLLDTPEDGPLKEELQQIELAATRAATLTRQLLAFSRKQVLQPARVDLNSVVRDMQGMVGRLIGEDVMLKSDLDPALGPTVTDPGQMEQVLVNLVVNARDAMPAGGTLTISTRNVDPAAVRAMTPELGARECVVLAVGDTGTGIPPDVRDHIFEPFYTTKGPGKGTGLGLSTVYGIVKQMEGHIHVETELGAGTTFSVLLPRAQAAPVSEIAPPQPAGARSGSETVLLVEDEALVRRFTRRVLQSQGYTILEAGNGDEALAISDRTTEPIDVLLTDVVMPGMSGKELAAELMRRRPGLRVLYMSGYTDDAIADHGVLEPGISLVEKPFTREGLTAMLRRVLAQRAE
jgi:PAS domain S-box-containing protein